MGSCPSACSVLELIVALISRAHIDTTLCPVVSTVLFLIACPFIVFIYARVLKVNLKRVVFKSSVLGNTTRGLNIAATLGEIGLEVLVVPVLSLEGGHASTNQVAPSLCGILY